MNPEWLALLACPVCKGPLQYNESTSELVCADDRIAFPLRDEVPVLLLMDARPLTREELDRYAHNETGEQN